MIQQRKKDYLERLIDEFFAKLHKLTDDNGKLSDTERRSLLDNCFVFFADNFGIYPELSLEDVVGKVDSIELLDQYSSLLLKKYELDTPKNKDLLIKALSLVEYLQNEDDTYSWDRTVLREDILRLLDPDNM